MQKLLIRFFDFIFSLVGLVILSPFFLVIALCISIDSRGGVFFRQSRVGKGGVDFILYKFRTMTTGAEKQGQITSGKHALLITGVGKFLRKYKLDELPQLINVIMGDMSLVGPRPEVRRYVELYSTDQRRILDVRPGITDYASIAYANENELLSKSDDPDKMYIEEIMPAKITLNLQFIEQPTIRNYFTIIFKTIAGIFA
jgi:lipopolysaccharide/colanic/teichoic acid biosynthesis glycosyltransferase